MKSVALAAAILLVGCATNAGPARSDQRIQGMDQRNAEITQREKDREEYQRQGEEERERGSLMMILTTSRPH
jgi:hypothetical protein